MTDRQTHRQTHTQTHDHGIYRASIASRGNKEGGELPAAERCFVQMPNFVNCAFYTVLLFGAAVSTSVCLAVLSGSLRGIVLFY